MISIFASAPLRTVPPVSEPPYRTRKPVPADPVGTFTVFGVAALLTATTYSSSFAPSVREKAYTESAAYRSVCTPSRSAGCRLVSLDSSAMDR